MFDTHSKSLFENFPAFEGLVRDDLKRALSRAYLAIVEQKINGEATNHNQVQSSLREIANTLLFHAVLNPKFREPERKSAAFVAAESLALLIQLLASDQIQEELKIPSSPRDTKRLVRIECALLYLYSGYDSCASGILHDTPTVKVNDGSIIEVSIPWALDRLERLCRLTYYPKLDSDFPFQTFPSKNLDPTELEDDTIARLFVELGVISSQYFDWLVGERQGHETLLARLEAIKKLLSPTQSEGRNYLIGHEYARVFHLATLMHLCFPALASRALVHVVPVPPNPLPTYKTYLTRRAKGNVANPGRPILWPSAQAYVSECLIRGTRNVVAAMPTGSGKSFVGELAVSQSVQSGWVLYLAPTNALTEQIRGDLRDGLRNLNTEVLAFVGDQEYSIFSNDRVDQMPSNSVAVMTPEKCSLALRLSPNTFANCSLVVFDECHLIGEHGSSRGPLSELVMAQIMVHSPSCKFLLMSAIVQNPEELAAWLHYSTGAQSTAIPIRWRPTRTLRAVLGVDDTSIQQQAIEAIDRLSTRNDRIKKQSIKAKCALAVNLQGAWQSENSIDYTVNGLNYQASLKVVRRKNNNEWNYHWEGDSWVNQNAIGMGVLLAESGIQTLIFTPANKHYPFQNGSKVRLTEELLNQFPSPSSFIDTCRTLAEYELGCESQVFLLLESGVAVHTSLMLETEKIASEMAFKAKAAPLMFATGTLAQGLNLPAVAVVIAGSRIGDPRGQDPEEVQRRKFSQLLNAAGRAGRAGFANQGFVIAIPDTPVAFSGIESFNEARSEADYLQHNDNAVPVKSGLTAFLDTVCRDSLQSNSASELELLATSLLAGGDDNQVEPASVLKKTYASYFRKINGQQEVSQENADNLIRVGTKFIEDTGAPDWITIASQRAGLDFFLTLAIAQAWGKIRPQLKTESMSWTVDEWMEELLKLIAHIPPALLNNYFPPDKIRHVSKEFSELIKGEGHLFEIRQTGWEAPINWVKAWESTKVLLRQWMTGESISSMAATITDVPQNSISFDRSAGKPIPKALSITHNIWSSLSQIAGGFLAVAEQILETVPLPLASLPMCLKYGCDSPETLAWFRFGLRLRRPSRALANRFPPPSFDSDEALKEWVQSVRNTWLKSEEPDDEVLNACRSFLTASRGSR